MDPRISIVREWARNVPIDLREDMAAKLLDRLDRCSDLKLSGSLVLLYRFCEEHAIDLELRLKPDGRGYLFFYRPIDGARAGQEFDLELGDDHSIQAALMRVVIPPIRTEEERVRLETPR